MRSPVEPKLSVVIVPLALIATLALACASGGDEASTPSDVQQQPAVPGIGAGGATTGGGLISSGATTGGAGSTVPVVPVVPPTTGGSSSAPPTQAPGALGGLIGGRGIIGGLTGGTGGLIAGLAGGAGFTGGAGAATGGGTPAPPPAGPPGPDDGDPSQPVVTIPNIKCGPNPSLFGLTTTNVMIGGRGVHVSYPCNKHKGAPVTFILNLHGTMPQEELKLYQVAYFAATNYVNSHNLITVAPISAGSQWGNDDGGKDLPHLKEVIAWTYSTFKDFDIRSMWIGGHSWGAMFTTTYACTPELQDKVRGVVLMSTFPMMPACAGAISVINTNAENDIAGPLPQGNIPMQHGCGAPMTSKLGNNDFTLYPNCMKGFVHANYLMYGKAHADYMDDVVVKSIVDLIKQARP
jgi:pimeloyl-ACP methyl ester carboxylesterase